MGFTLWLGLGWPTGVNRWLDVGESPTSADAIICLTGGTTSENLPIDYGWKRIHTATELYADGYAPVTVFSGGGFAHGLSEAEVYADAAVWLGMRRAATVIDSHPESTAQHSQTLLAVTLPGGVRLTRGSRLLLVTSWFHARRALLTFRRAGFSNVRVITSYQSATAEGQIGRHRRQSSISASAQSAKSYHDFFNNAADGYRDVFTMLREGIALVWYWRQGWI